MFYGSSNSTLDDKGRLIMPKQFREQLGEAFTITRGLDGCLFVFPEKNWASFEEKLSKMPLTNKNARKVARFFAAGATPCTMDRQGRVLIPEMLREFAGLSREVVVAGDLERVEIWDKEKYIAATAEEDIDDVVESLDDLDLGF